MKELKEAQARFNRVFVENPDGRKVLEEIKEHAGIYCSGYVADSDRTVFNAGRRSIALWIENMSRTDNKKLAEEQG